MKGSFLRLVVSSVLVAWFVGAVVIISYARSRRWGWEEAQKDSVLLLYDRIDAVPPDQRAARLRELTAHTWIPLGLASLEDTYRHTGRMLRPGQSMPFRDDERDDWFYVAFSDGKGALVAGPVDPRLPPPGLVPIGVFLLILGLPAIAGFVVFRVQREIEKVERASQALAVGELGVRVDNERGPSNELAAEFNAMAERIETLVRSRDELVQAVSHELGSPLSRLRFHVELMENDATDKQRERLGGVNRELDALDELVAELLSYVQADDLQLDRARFDPHPSLRDLAELVALEFGDEKSVAIELELDANEVDADPRLFQRAVENLMRNAVQHATNRVDVTLAADEALTRVSVHDDGPGIAPEMRDAVRAPFVRLAADRDRRTGGVGLGLAIVHRIVQRHGGSLEIATSERLGGARVTTSWPTPRES